MSRLKSATGLMPAVRESLLSLLVLNPDREYYTRQAAALCQVPLNSAVPELRRFARLGIAHRRVSGRQTLYQANERCPYLLELRGWLTKTAGILAPVQEALSCAKGVDLAFIYGSFAEGTATADSDVDLLVVGRLGLRQASLVQQSVRATISRDLSVLALAREQFAQRLKANDHFLTEVLRGPRLWVKGSEEELAQLRT